MKLTQREKNSQLIIFGFFTLLLIVLVFYTVSYFYPKIVEIEGQKKELIKLIDSKNDIEKKGITFAEFKILNKTLEDIYFKNVISNINEDFYNQNFRSEGNMDFDTFIKEKIKEINSDENSEKLIKQNEKISKILPSYLKGGYSLSNSNLTNFKFINYLEAIFQTFNIETDDKIGITNIELLGDYEDLNGKNNSLESSLFAIPLKLELEGTKEGIINFLHFANMVGSVKIDEELNDYYVENDNFLETKYGKTILKGNIPTKDYNIYENQIFTIDYIKFKDNLDTSSKFKGNMDFIEFIKSTQGTEEYSVEVKLKFYTKGIEQYELVAAIESILNKYYDLNKEVNKILKSTTISKYEIIDFKKASKYLQEISKEIANLKKELNKKENLEGLYLKVLKYNSPLTQIENLIK